MERTHQFANIIKPVIAAATETPLSIDFTPIVQRLITLAEFGLGVAGLAAIFLITKSFLNGKASRHMYSERSQINLHRFDAPRNSNALGVRDNRRSPFYGDPHFDR